MAKNVIHSIQQRLLAISRSNRINHQQTLTLYFIERFLYRISISDYKDKFILKGGMFLYSKTDNLNRPTKDIDLLAQEYETEKNEIQEKFEAIAKLEYESDGVLFDSTNIQISELEKQDKYSG